MRRPDRDEIVSASDAERELGRRDRVADPPARDRVRLRDAGDGDGALGHAGQRGDRRVAEAVVDDVLVDLVGDRQEVVLEAEIGDGLELVAREDLAGRVIGAVEDDGARAGRHRPPEPVRVEGEVRRLERDERRLGAGDHAPRPIVLVERLEDDDLVARIQHGQQRRQHGLRRSAADCHVAVGIDLHPVELAVFLGDPLPQARRPPRDRVLVEVAVDRLVGRRDQLRRRGEVGHALGQVHAADLIDDARHLADDRLGECLDAPGDLHYGTITSRSIGSTWTPRSLSHRTPRSSAPSSPSSSSAIHPWSAFTSARRMLMTRSKSLTRRYTIGSWISSVGNVSRRRMRGIASTGSTAPGDGGNDRDLIAVLEHRLLRLEEPDVLLVHVDIDEAPQLTRLVHEPFLQPGELALQVLHETLHRVALGLDLGVALRERAERGRDPYEHRHARSSYTAWDLRSASARSKADSDGLMFTWTSRRSLSASGVLRPLPVMQMTIDSVLWMTPVSMSFRVAATVTPPAVSVKMPSVRASKSIPSTISSSVTCAPKPPDSFTVL